MAPGGYPRQFGSYVLLKPLARGGMGELDLAVTGDHGMEKLCVIKRVLPHLLAAENVQRFREEAMMVVRLSHGNLVGVLDAGRQEGQFYLAMDFVEGKDLLATWNQCAARRVAFPVEIAAYVIKELARGLGYAHAYRDLHLVHRDISPANVLLSYSGEVRLTDFGLATSKLKEQRTAPGIIYGKLAYLAPEQARGQPLDGRTDLYAAGILLWEMLTGQQLFPTTVPGAVSPSSGHNSTLEALERVKNPVVKPPSAMTSRVPPALDAIVLRALRTDPAERYQTGEDFRLDLASFLAKHAPQTDAATLATFMTLLWDEQIDHERTDRDILMRDASPLLSAGTVSGAIGAANVAPTPASTRSSAEWLVSPSTSDPQRPRVYGPGRDALRAADRAGDPSAPTGPLPRPVREGLVIRDPRDRRSANQIRQAVVQRSQGDDARLQTPSQPTMGLDADLRGHLGYLSDADPRDGAAPRPDPSPVADADAGFSSQLGEHIADEDPRVGTTIAARYFLRRLCGEGAMGRVYEGHHVEIGRRVAIKILHSTFSNTPEVVERFRREARAASKIGHPNIVDVTDAGTTPDGAFFFVMEYLDGVDLEQLIGRDGSLTVERALLIAAQVCRALVAAHTAGIIHRDLKPANVMLIRHRDEEDFVKVLDFGISKQSELDIDPRGKHVGLTRPDAAVGTPIYMAPEQVSGHPADGRTDVYAVGELLFEMLTGVAACPGGDVIAVFNKKANEDPPTVRSLRPDVPISIETLLTKAMSRKPADRHATMTVLKDEIMGCLARIDEGPVPVAGPRHTESESSHTAPIARPGSRAIWITGAGVIAGLGVAAVFVLWPAQVSTPTGAFNEARIMKAVPPMESVPTSRSPSPPLLSPSPSPPLSPPQSRSTSPSSPTRAKAPPASTAALSTAPSRTRPPARARLAAAPSQPPPGLAPTGSGNSSTKPPATDALLKGRSAFAKGNFPEAVRLARAILASGDAVGGHLLLGDAFYKMERYAEAVAEYDAALKASPGHPLARRGRELAIRHSQR